MNMVLSNAQVFYSNQASIQKWIYQSEILDLKDRIQVHPDSGLPVLENNMIVWVRKQDLKFLSNLIMNMQVSAVTATAPATGILTMSLINGFLIFMLQHIELMSGDNIISTAYLTQIYNALMQDNTDMELALHEYCLEINSTTNLQTTAMASQSFTLNLCEVFGLLGKTFSIFLLNDTLDFNFVFNSPIDNLIDTNASAPQFSFLNFYLTATYQHAVQGVYDVIASNIKANSVYVLYDYQYMEIINTITAGSDAIQFPLIISVLIDKDVVLINNVIRNSTDLITNLACNYTNYQSCASYTIKVSGFYISGTEFDFIDSFLRINLLDEYNFKRAQTLITENIYPISYCTNIVEAQSTRVQCFQCCKSFHEVSDAMINLNFTSSPSSVLTVYTEIVAAKQVAIINGYLHNVV